MPKYNKAKLVTLRNNIDQYLTEADQEEKTIYKQLDKVLDKHQVTIDKIFDRIADDKSMQKYFVALKSMRNELGEAIKASRPDMSGVVNAIEQIVQSIPKTIHDPEMVAVLRNIEKGFGKKTQKVTDRTDEIVKAIQEIKVTAPEIEFPEFPKEMVMSNFRVANVTNVSINPLRGLVHSTNQTITTTLNKIPGYGVLDNRRSLMLFNNSASTTIYIGGSNVTSSNGLPILGQTYSPVIDSGIRMILYGVTSSSTADIRVMEVSNDAIGG